MLLKTERLLHIIHQNLVLDGIAYTFGVLLEPLVKAFDSNRVAIQ